MNVTSLIHMQRAHLSGSLKPLKLPRSSTIEHNRAHSHFSLNIGNSTIPHLAKRFSDKWILNTFALYLAEINVSQ